MAYENVIRPSGTDYKFYTQAVRDADAKLAELVEYEQAQKERVNELLDAMSVRESEKILSEMSVDCLNSAKQGYRISALKNAGIENMSQLCALKRQQVVNIHGLGEDTALSIYAAAGKIKAEVRANVKLRISVDDKSAEETELVCQLNRAVAAEKLTKQAAQLYGEYHENIVSALKTCAPAGSGVKWLFASSRKKAEAVRAFDYLASIAEGGYTQTADELYAQFGELEEKPAEECWADFELRSAVYYSRLESLDRNAAARMDNTSCGLPAQLVQEVEQEPLYVDKLKATLRSYQEFGVKYILHQRNVLLGDEMGLGKTVQAIAAMVSLAAQGATHFMVVCPASVQVNWSREIAQFSDLDVTMIRGGDFAAARSWVNRGGVAVTTYESISRFGVPENFTFTMLVADEAHYAKNPMAKRTQYLRVFSRRAERTLFMTGTPLENRVDEMCYIIGTLNSEVAAELENIKYLSSAPQFREKLAPVYLRRTREDVLTELPELIEKEQWCELTAEEGERYLYSVMSNNFMAMRQVSWDVRDLKNSSKAQRLLQLCEMAEEEGRRVIIFSFFRDTIDRVCNLLKGRCMEPITGSVSAVKRQQIIDEFSQSPAGSALVCQIQAGGTGLNIQSASVIIFCEPQIKPSLETQAISRAYRMGQVRSVIVHRLLCDNTVDERIMELLQEKQDIFDSFADASAVGDEYMKNERSMVKQIIASEKQRLGCASDQTTDNETDEI